MNNSLKNFKRLNTLSIGFAKSASNQATIYANGDNQVEILVSLSMQGLDNKPLEISQEELQEVLYLCDYHTGEEIEEPWIISFNENEYNRAVSYQDVVGTKPDLSSVEEERGKLYVSLYVSASKIVKDGQIAVGIGVPGVGDFDTSKDGTGIPNAPGGDNGLPFKNPRYVNVKLIKPIDYSLVSNTEVRQSTSKVLDKNLMRENFNCNNKEYTTYNDGKIEKIIVNIKTRDSKNKFLHYELNYKGIENSDVSKGSIYWHDVLEDAFSVVKGPHLPAAVIGRDINSYDYQVNFWYSKKDIHLDGWLVIYGANGDYRCSVKVDDKHKDASDTGIVVLYLYKLTVPTRNYRQYKWENVIDDINLYVKDIYGNHGNLILTFDSSRNFDIPLIKSGIN